MKSLNSHPASVGMFWVFAVLGGLAALVGVNYSAPGCTGPAVERCDYVATAADFVAKAETYPFQNDLGFEVFDQGSSVIVQQFTPPGEPELNHATSVLIDKKSCRPCSFDFHQPTSRVASDSTLGPVIARTPARDTAGAARRAEAWKGGPGGVAFP